MKKVVSIKDLLNQLGGSFWGYLESEDRVFRRRLIDAVGNLVRMQKFALTDAVDHVTLFAIKQYLSETYDGDISAFAFVLGFLCQHEENPIENVFCYAQHYNSFAKRRINVIFLN